MTRFNDVSQVPDQYWTMQDGSRRLDATKGRWVSNGDGTQSWDVSTPTRGQWNGGFWIAEDTPLGQSMATSGMPNDVWKPVGGNQVTGFDYSSNPNNVPQGLSRTPSSFSMGPQPGTVAAAVQGKGVGMPAPQEPGMPAPSTFGAAVQPGGQGAPMGGNPFAGLPPASGGAPMFGDGSPRMFGTPAQPGGQGAPMGGNPFAGLPPASGGAPMFEDDPFRMMYTGGTPNFDETTGQFRTPLPMGAGKFPFAGLPPASGGSPMFGDGSPRMVGHHGRRGRMTTPFSDQVRNPGTIPAIINEILRMQGIAGGQQPTSMTVPLNPGMTYTRPNYQPGTLPRSIEEYSNDFSWF